jgi:hypothetical protein
MCDRIAPQTLLFSVCCAIIHALIWRVLAALSRTEESEKYSANYPYFSRRNSAKLVGIAPTL